MLRRAPIEVAQFQENKKHLYDLALRVGGENGLAHRMSQERFDAERNIQDLQVVLKVHHLLLPRRAWQMAERLQHQHGQVANRRGLSGHDARRKAMEETYHFLANHVLPKANASFDAWFHLLEHGRLPDGVNPEEYEELAAVVRHRRLLMARLKQKWLASRLRFRSGMLDPAIRDGIREMVRKKEITPQAAKKYRESIVGLDALRLPRIIDPESYIRYLTSKKLGIHPTELEIIKRWSDQDLEEITGVKLKDLEKARKKADRSRGKKKQ